MVLATISTTAARSHRGATRNRPSAGQRVQLKQEEHRANCRTECQRDYL